MAASVAVYQIMNNRRSRMIAEAMRRGINALGDRARLFDTSGYRSPDADIAVFYGFDTTLRRIFRDYRALGRPVVCIDLGYWGRRDGGIWDGYHKVAVNDRHPTAYFQKVRHSGDRVSRHGISISQWTSGRHVVIAGMSAKAAEAAGFAPEEWERQAIAAVKAHTDRPIVYRPKPSWPDAKPLPDSTFEHGQMCLDRLLQDCHAVVTHHSNVGVDGLLAGVPVFCVEGAALPLACEDISKIEQPRKDGDRRQWAQDLAYTQFKPDEMHAGVAWRHLKDEGLL